MEEQPEEEGGQKWSWAAASSTAIGDTDSTDSHVQHKKRLAMILRYIATMHHSNDASKGISFVSPVGEAHDDDDVLFSTQSFRHILALDPDGTLFSSPPFCFYKAVASPKASRKRTLARTIKRSSSVDSRAVWFRITRLTAESPPRATPAVRQYLESWKESSGAHSIRNLLRLDRIATAPKATLHSGEIKSFLKQYKKYLKRASMRTALEPLYNRLFEWLQDGEGELVWGMGMASLQTNEISIHGPLLQVLVEVELSRDGALLVRPRPHTGVALNREVSTALTTNRTILSNLHRTISELETDQLSPGEPSTYTKLLKRMAHELSCGGTFQSAASGGGNVNSSKLVVTDAWCLFHRPHASTVWARDASVLAERVISSPQTLPVAAWSLTHGPDMLASIQQTTQASTNMWTKMKATIFGGNSNTSGTAVSPRPLLALPTSEAQNRIAGLMLQQNYPAIVCEGPPGTGKTHTIANLVCAYLCQGKRVLVTSKGAPALSVLRERLPKSVQELCVDVSMSESTGMRQLQQTVERLADKVSCISTDIQEEQCLLLQRTIQELEHEMQDIDGKLLENAERKRKLVQSRGGQELIDMSFNLYDSAPWLAKTLSNWTVAETEALLERCRSLLVTKEEAIHQVTGYESPPSDGLISLVASHAGNTLSVVKDAASRAVASIPILGSRVDEHREQLQQEIAAIRVHGNAPSSTEDWQLVLRALQLDKDVNALHDESLKKLMDRESWPKQEIYEGGRDRKRITKTFVDLLGMALKWKELAYKCNAQGEIELALEARELDSRRSKIPPKIQHLAQGLVEATVVTQLSRMFSPQAQSALIRFAQIAGKAKFSKSSQASKMSQRQRRHRQEYLDAFEKCVRYIPCWILTSSQISDYLPAECGLFDLVVIDEASQSDITALPGMLRGKQWLIVGDGKQVSPSESFMSESQIDSLRAALPESPLEESLLPGRSFFDLCAQAFPRGRVVLREHFRCAPEIISFSNDLFYDGRLVPLRLPTSAERLSPSLEDVRVRGTKSGKVNEVECDKIVEMIQDYVRKSSSDTFPRSIGVISLVGDEQSRLIRGRLLDAIGGQQCSAHNIKVGDASTFQGAERDIIFLSMVCSPGRVPTQSQLMYAQRANVALSRARDRMVLVRSIDSSHVPSNDDIKLPIIEFFEGAGSGSDSEEDEPSMGLKGAGLFSFGIKAQSLLEQMLCNDGYSVRRMGVVWNDGICVENKESGTRAAVCFECAGETTDEWSRLVKQQKSIERVGWKTFRVDALSFLVDCPAIYKSVKEFLQNVGVEASLQEEIVEVDEDDIQAEEAVDAEPENAEPAAPEENAAGANESVVVSSGDEEEDRKQGAAVESDVDMEDDEEMDPAQYGDLANLAFLRGSAESMEEDDFAIAEDPYQPRRGRARARNDDVESGSEDEDDGGDAYQPRRGRARARNDDVESGSEDEDDDGDAYQPRRGRARARKDDDHVNLESGSEDNDEDKYQPRRGRAGARNDDDVVNLESGGEDNGDGGPYQPRRGRPRARSDDDVVNLESGSKDNDDGSEVQVMDVDSVNVNVENNNDHDVGAKKDGTNHDDDEYKNSNDDDDEDAHDHDHKKKKNSNDDDEEFIVDDNHDSSDDGSWQRSPGAAQGVARAPSEGDSSDGSDDNPRRRKRHRRTRMDKYSRDGRWFPGKYKKTEQDVSFRYDTDSDLAPTPIKQEPKDEGKRLPDANAESDDESPL